MKKIITHIAYTSLAIIFVLMAYASPKQASAGWTYYGHSIPYTVIADIPQDAISVKLSANPASMTLPSNQTVLTWTTTNSPDSCTASGGSSAWPGAKSPSGGNQTMAGLNAGSYVYNILCSKAGLSDVNAQATVVINTTNPKAVTASLVANPNHLPFGGGSSILTWGSTNASSCTGSGFITGGSPSGATSVSLTITKTYTVLCTGTNGSAQAQATIIVSPKDAGDGGGGGDGGEPKPQCSDAIDNDADKLIDIEDPGCHSDKDPKNDKSYLPLKDSEKNGAKPIYIEI